MDRKAKTAAGVTLALIVIFSLIGCISWKSNNESFKEDNAVEKNLEDVFPSKTIQLVVPYSPGGGTDSVARALADSAKKYFSKPIVVVNKTGDGGAVGMAEGANSNPDGYTATMITGELATLPNLGLATFTYKDFRPILQVNSDPAALTVKADAPWNTVEEFLEYAKQNPEKIKIGNSGRGSIWHLAAISIEKGIGIRFKHVFFDGAAPAVVDLLGGYIDAVTVSPAEVLTHVKNDELKVLGVLSAKRIKSLSTVPTLKEQGYDFVIGTWRGIGVPKDTPEDVVKILQETFIKAAQDPAFIEMMNKLELGYKVATEDEFLETIKTNHDFFKELIEDLDIEK